MGAWGRPAAIGLREVSAVSHMMMNGCGVAMMLFGGVGMLLGLVLVASLIVVIWVVIGRLRREPMVPPPVRA